LAFIIIILEVIAVLVFLLVEQMNDKKLRHKKCLFKLLCNRINFNWRFILSLSIVKYSESFPKGNCMVSSVKWPLLASYVSVYLQPIFSIRLSSMSYNLWRLFRVGWESYHPFIESST